MSMVDLIVANIRDCTLAGLVPRKVRLGWQAAQLIEHELSHLYSADPATHIYFTDDVTIAGIAIEKSISGDDLPGWSIFALTQDGMKEFRFDLKGTLNG